MKVIHIESGLGNQMLSYCEYMALKSVNPDDDFYLEDIIYDIPECDAVTCQWNGYELKRIFGIDSPPNVRKLFSDEEWQQIMADIRASEFWRKNMNFPIHFLKAFKNAGLELINTFGDFEDPVIFAAHQQNPNGLKYKLKHTLPWFYLKRYKETVLAKKKGVDDNSDELFPITSAPLFAGQKLLFKYKGYGIERIEDEIRRTFRFPDFEDEQNKQAAKQIEACQSVAIHARRGDMLGTNGYYYTTGYFRKAVAHIRKYVATPTFFIFCDPRSVSWAKENAHTLGLDFKKDTVHFVDWNKGEDSFRDMQLMSLCKHQIITNSSFGWWGAWLNTNPDKITCSPDFRINTTNTF